MIDPISWAYSWPYLLGALLAGYAIGSIPFGMALTRLGGYGDIRRIGSGNIGATNVLRTGNRTLAALTLALDAGKGALAAAGAARWGPDVAILAALGAMLGHLFPVWLRFRGGKGVATALGVLLGLAWPVAALAGLTWGAVAALCRYSSLAALAAATTAPVYAWWLADPQRTEFCVLLAVIVWLTHIGNIRRLATGAEPRLGQSE